MKELLAALLSASFEVTILDQRNACGTASTRR